MIIVYCDHCNKEYESHACWIKRQAKHFCSKECKVKAQSQDMTGSGNYNFRNAQIIRECKNCGSYFKFFKSEEKWRPLIFCCRECADEHRKVNKLYGFRLDKHWNWQGGLSFEQYPLEFHNKREQIRDKYDRTCQRCGTKETDKRKLDIHHIDYDKKNSDDKNLIPLCISCHIKTNYNREHWINLFNSKLENVNV